jgi:hypothetical protein
MAGIVKVAHGDDDVYEATTTVDGGMVVIPSGTATHPELQGIAPATAGATNVLGVAARRAVPVGSQATTGTDSDGYPYAAPNVANELTTVYKACKVPVTYTAAAVAFGKKLKAAANGQVALWVSGTDAADLIIGECRVIGGMGSGGGVGLAYIY